MLEILFWLIFTLIWAINLYDDVDNYFQVWDSTIRKIARVINIVIALSMTIYGWFFLLVTIAPVVGIS